MIKKIKILHILPNLSGGGAEKVCFDILNNLNPEKYDRYLILFKDQGQGEKMKLELNSKGIEIICLNKKSRLGVNNFYSLYKKIKELSPDICHTHLGADVRGRIAAAIARVKVIVSTEHNINISESKIITFLKKHSAYLNKKTFAVSRAVKEDARQRYNLKEESLAIVYNGVDINFFSPSQGDYKKMEENSLVIGSMGRLSKQKGLSFLIEAAARVKSKKDLNFQIAGEGEDELILKKQIRKLDLFDKIKLLGFKPAKDFLEEIDIFVFPSRWEGLGLALLEAMAMEVPVIASDTGGIKEVLGLNCGILFKQGDEVDLADKLDYLLSNIDKPEVKEMAKKGRELVVNRFSLEKMLLNYESWYDKLYSDSIKYAHTPGQ